MKVRAVIQILEEDGWYLVRQRGSHKHFKHPRKRGIVTVAGHPNEDVPAGTLHHIWRQAQIDRPEPRR